VLYFNGFLYCLICAID